MRYARVYRIEHAETGRGPFNDWCNAKLLNYTNSESHPTPLYEFNMNPHFQHQCDVRGLFPSSCFYGVSNLNQLHHWFPTHVQRQLAKRGYVVRSYAVPVEQVAVLNTQVMFRKD